MVGLRCGYMVSLYRIILWSCNVLYSYGRIPMWLHGVPLLSDWLIDCTFLLHNKLYCTLFSLKWIFCSLLYCNIVLYSTAKLYFTEVCGVVLYLVWSEFVVLYCTAILYCTALQSCILLKFVMFYFALLFCKVVLYCTESCT